MDILSVSLDKIEYGVVSVFEAHLQKKTHCVIGRYLHILCDWPLLTYCVIGRYLHTRVLCQ